MLNFRELHPLNELAAIAESLVLRIDAKQNISVYPYLCAICKNGNVHFQYEFVATPLR